jgi:hypothetical protein
MKHRRASGFLLAAIVGAAASLSDMPVALSQSPTPTCELTATAAVINGAALNTAAQIKIGVVFNAPALRLSGAGPGKVISAPFDLTPLGMANTQMVITGARLRTNIVGDVRFFLSSSESPEWVQAFRCDNIPTNLDFCVRFPKSAGRTLRWMALMTNSAGAPQITSVQWIFDYIQDDEHYRGGIAQFEGVSYYGGFSPSAPSAPSPGNLGQLYATSFDLRTVYWRARDRLASSTRKIFTANGTQTIPFETGYEADLAPVLGRTAAEVTNIVNWVRNTARFGIAGNPERRFGGVISSTPIVVGKPEFPVWYFRASQTRRDAFLAFRATRFSRPPLVLYGAKDGMVHALHTDSTNVTDSDLGKEAWAFIPTGIAARMGDDFNSTITNGFTTVSAYPDTWPVYDHVLIGGEFATVAVFAHGRGGKGISAVNIDDSVRGDAVVGYTVPGPQPLWERAPQATSTTPSATYDPGLALNRPAIARVQLGTSNERFMVIAGTGLSYDDPERIDQNGRIVAAYDAETGALYWKFKTMCPLTTAISVFETNDQGEPGSPDLNGFMDRAVFGDRCGYIYKIDLTAEIAGGWTRGIGAIPTESVDGVQLSALFRTDNGRPVTGNIAVRAVVDADTTRVALFFGTGGLDEQQPFLDNTFYALAAAPEEPTDTDPRNLVFQKILGSCPTATSCEKFYGGARVSPLKVIFTRVLEPPIGVGAASCDTQPGRTVIEARSLVGDVTTALTQQPPDFQPVTVNAVMTNPLSGSGPTFAFVTQEGEARQAGGDVNGDGVSDTISTGSNRATADQASFAAKRNSPMLILGWRQVY